MLKQRPLQQRKAILQIGNFSAISNVSVKTLRYYDEIELLTPTEVDVQTGYRYYSVDQLPRLNKILALKDLGLSLDQVAKLVDDNLSASQIREMLGDRRREIQDKLEVERSRLERVEARLAFIEREGTLPQYDIVVKRLDPYIVASIRDYITKPEDQLSLWKQLAQYFSIKHTRVAAPSIAQYHRHHQTYNTTEVELMTPTDSSLEDGGVKIRMLPGETTVASVVHKGGYTAIGQAYALLDSWIELNRYQVCGLRREVYLRGPYDMGEIPMVYNEFMAKAPSDYVTEIQIPIEKYRNQ
jgi:DNA-binding transcriptional MerR regulator